MLQIKHVILSLLTVVISLTINSQTPSYYKLGEEELSGINIYDILQDKDNNYWLATDNGIIKYDGYSFKTIACKKALSNSVFDFKLDYNNNLFCKNLSGQIFQIKNDTCKVYFQIPDSLMYKNVHYAFDVNNDLIIITNTTFSVKSDKTIHVLENQKLNNSYTDIIVQKDSSILTYQLGKDKLIRIKNGVIKEEKIQCNAAYLFLSFISFNNKIHYFNWATSNLLHIQKNTFSINPQFSPTKNKEERLRFYSTNNLLWVSRQSGGVMVLDADYKPLFNNKTLFKNNIISKIYKDIEGNILLGTFGDGLIVIPNINLEDVHLSDKEIKYTRITSNTENTVFFGTQNGTVFQIDTNLVSDLIWDQKNKNIEVLKSLNETNSLLIDGNRTFIYQLNSNKEQQLNWGAIKDVINISKNNYLFASSSGVYLFNALNFNIKNEPIPNFTDRTNCVSYNPTTETIYAGTASGLKIGNKNKVDFFLLDGNAIICKEMLYFKNQVYVTTQKNGVLIFKNERLVDSWNTENGFPTNTLKQIKSYKHKLYFSSNKGIIVTDSKGEVFSILNKSEGFYSNKIIDFEVRNDILWLIHQKGIQKININSLSSFNCTPTISFNDIWINDTINSSTHNATYSYQQNKFEFYLSANSLKFKDEINYLHQLIGIDNGWQSNNYENHKIEYKSLPPGNYIFKVKAKCRNRESEVIAYQFEITPPFWNTWWFYLVIILLFITITYLIYQREIKKQRKKIQLQNELNASKLIAIQSQMNPHFIFNSINSIQDLILKGDIDNSYSYIIKFSKLVRQTLNFSDKEFIDIEDEIDLLKTYLKLEKLRFKADFEYRIECDLCDVQVPPMLVQPFVENAIKHGLLHKDGLKKLTISFSKDTILHCTITDNGIGRKKAQEIKNRRQKSHQSFSVNATRSRFEIMKSHYQQDLGVRFEDLMDNEGASGTKVIINMPFKQSY